MAYIVVCHPCVILHAHDQILKKQHAFNVVQYYYSRPYIFFLLGPTKSELLQRFEVNDAPEFWLNLFSNAL